MLEQIRKNCRAIPIDPSSVAQYCISNGGIPITLNPFPSCIPCSVVHPDPARCYLFWVRSFIGTFRKTLPTYAAVTFGPSVVFKFGQMLHNPSRTFSRGFFGTVRSAAFLATFVLLYQATMCILRRCLKTDHKYFYFLAGIICSASIFVEKKGRRGELALYVLPRAIHSSYRILLERKWILYIPYFDLLMFCVGMGGLMLTYEKAPHLLSPALRTILYLLFKPTISSE